MDLLITSLSVSSPAFHAMSALPPSSFGAVVTTTTAADLMETKKQQQQLQQQQQQQGQQGFLFIIFTCLLLDFQSVLVCMGLMTYLGCI